MQNLQHHHQQWLYVMASVLRYTCQPTQEEQETFGLTVWLLKT